MVLCSVYYIKLYSHFLKDKGRCWSFWSALKFLLIETLLVGLPDVHSTLFRNNLSDVFNIFWCLYEADWHTQYCLYCRLHNDFHWTVLCPSSSISSEGVCTGPMLFIICAPPSKKACLARVTANTAQMSNYSSGTREMPEECGRFTGSWNVMLLVFSGGVDLEGLFFFHWEHITSCCLFQHEKWCSNHYHPGSKSCFYQIRQVKSRFTCL